VTLPNGISENVESWLVANIDGAVAPFHYTQIAGGHSNLTFKVDDAAGHSYVLRRPPLGHRLASAHDMGREHRIIAGLAHSAVPVAPALGLCTDENVNELPFYVMSFVDGHVIREKSVAESLLGESGCRRASESIVDTMAAIHGYEELMKRIPEQGAATLVHGDYRLDNCMVDAHGNVIAVLDWEICTLGDPMADLGLLMVYWTGPTDEASAWSNPVNTAAGFMNRAELAERYARVSGRDISQLSFYEAFAFWKLACIIEGVYARYLGGALGQKDPAELEPFRLQVEGASQRAASILEKLS